MKHTGFLICFFGELVGMQSNTQGLPRLNCQEEFNLNIKNPVITELLWQANSSKDQPEYTSGDLEFLRSMKELMGDSKKTAWVESIISQLGDNKKHQRFKDELLYHMCASIRLGMLSDLEVTNMETLLQHHASGIEKFDYDYYYKQALTPLDRNITDFRSVIASNNSVSIINHNPRLLRIFLKNSLSPSQVIYVWYNHQLSIKSLLQSTFEDMINNRRFSHIQRRMNLLLYFNANPYSKRCVAPDLKILKYSLLEFIRKNIAAEVGAQAIIYIEKMYKERLVQVISQHANNYIFKKAMHLPKELAIMIADFAIEEFKKLDWEKKALTLKFEPICWQEEHTEA